MKIFFVKLGAVFVAVLVLYYIMSPYQQCMRNEFTRGNDIGCRISNSW